MNRSEQKFLLVVGTLGWFADSIRVFAENGYQCFFVRSSATNWFRPNFLMFQTLGFQEVVAPFDMITPEAFGAGGVILSGNQWEPHCRICSVNSDADETTLGEHERAARLLRNRGVSLLSVRMLNGDVLFTDSISEKKFQSLNVETDLFVADSENVERYVRTHCPALAGRRFVVSPVDAPLARFAQLLEQPDPVDQYLHSGRAASTKFPKLDFPVLWMPPKKGQVNLPPFNDIIAGRAFRYAGYDTVARMERDRADVGRLFGRLRGGVGHFYDFFTADPSADVDQMYKEYATKRAIEGEYEPYDLPPVYRLTNTASKVLMYLTMGMPPVIPNDRDNSFHRALIDRDMCIPIDRDGVMPQLTRQRLSEIRANIRANLEVYTFNCTFDAIDARRVEMLENPGNFEDRWVRRGKPIEADPSFISVAENRPRKDRFLLIVGSLCWFNDSYRVFAEAGYRCFFKRTSCMPWQSRNFCGFAEMGFVELDDPVEQLADAGFAGGIVIQGLHYEPKETMYVGGGTGYDQMEQYCKIATGLKARGVKVLALKLTNGDTLFTDADTLAKFEKWNEPTDAIFCDNEGCERFIRGHCKSLAGKPFVTMPLEGPLKRFVRIREEPGLEDAWFHMGRPASTKLPSFKEPLVFLPARLPNRGKFSEINGAMRLFPAGFQPLHHIDLDRRMAIEIFGKCRGGVSHFYDFYTVDPSITEEELYAGYSQKQTLQGLMEPYYFPLHYRLTNIASKAITYLMMGLPPVIPDDPSNPFHKQLLDNHMCIPVGKDMVVPRLSEAETLRICRNIADHMEVFTVDDTFKKIDRMATEMLEYRAAAVG
jgi:hypothetical protein